MKRILKFVWHRIRRNWRDARGLPPWPSKACNICVLCGRKQRQWEKYFIPVFGVVRDDSLWFPTEPQVSVPVHEHMDRYQFICRDHGGKKGMVVLDANDGQEVIVPPYKKRIKVYRVFREVVWWVQVMIRFAGYSFKEVVFLILFPKRYVYWAKLLGGW